MLLLNLARRARVLLLLEHISSTLPSPPPPPAVSAFLCFSCLCPRHVCYGIHIHSPSLSIRCLSLSFFICWVLYHIVLYYFDTIPNAVYGMPLLSPSGVSSGLPAHRSNMDCLVGPMSFSWGFRTKERHQDHLQIAHERIQNGVLQ